MKKLGRKSFYIHAQNAKRPQCLHEVRQVTIACFMLICIQVVYEHSMVIRLITTNINYKIG
jgi:hypothetical protein